MGQSTNAILFYGYCWDEETSRPWTIGVEDERDESEDYDGWEERYASRKGLLPPPFEYPERRVKATQANHYNTTPRDEDYTPDELHAVQSYRVYWAAKRELVDASPCEVDTHCSGECPFVAIKASKIVSYRGHMNEVKHLHIPAEWDTQLEEFCEVMGIKTTDQPRWWLVSDWN